MHSGNGIWLFDETLPNKHTKRDEIDLMIRRQRESCLESVLIQLNQHHLHQMSFRIK